MIFVEHGDTFVVNIRCRGEDALIRLLGKLEVVVVVSTIYEYGSSKILTSRGECDTMVVLVRN